MRVSHNNLQVRHIKREVVIAAVPQNNVRFFLGLANNLFVIHTCIDDHTVINVRLIFLALLNGALVFIEIVIICVALNFLCHEISIRHRVTDGGDFVTHLLQDGSHAPRGLTFA